MEIITGPEGKRRSDIFYGKSNERYNDELIYLLRSTPVTEYIGVLGGGDQNLTIIAALQNKNPALKNIKLFDINQNQIEESAKRMLNYYPGTNDEYFSMLKGYNLSIREDTKITIEYKNISIPIAKANEKGIYFVYLSNITPFNVKIYDHYRIFGSFYMQNNFTTSDNILEKMSKNKSIQNGSIVMVADPAPYHGYSNVLLLRKDSHAVQNDYPFSVYYYYIDKSSILKPLYPVLRK
ncbi:MAG: hypothetical protein ACP5RM_03220 [Candidatus Micrarchaeia archaeon]